MYFKSTILLCSLLATFFIPLLAKDVQSSKIALLFLTRSEPNHPKLWQELLEESAEKYTVYIHSKEELSKGFFQQYRIPKIVPTTWSIHMRAWQVLIQASLKDSDNQWFVFLSESCVPLYSLDHIYRHIRQDKHSHIWTNEPWWLFEGPREINEIYQEFRLGNWEWAVLSRKHAEIIAQDRALIGIISKHQHDQESYLGTLFKVYDCLSEICCHSYTYTNWDYAEGDGCHPYCFREINDFNNDLLEAAYKGGHLFARKFAKEYPQADLLEMIRRHSKKNKGQ